VTSNVMFLLNWCRHPSLRSAASTVSNGQKLPSLPLLKVLWQCIYLQAAMCVFVTNYKWLCVGLGICALLLTLNFLRWVSWRVLST
jgi:hypothetical protein